MTKIKLVISDFHLSRGSWLKDGRRNPLEDFNQDEKFCEFLDHYSSGIYKDVEVELIVNGDFFDPLAVVPLPDPKGRLPSLEYPLEVEEPAAVEKFQTIFAGHPLTVKGLIQFLARGKKIIFRWGNHDAALLWPKIQEYLRDALAPPRPELLEFQQHPYIFDRICIDHGHQYEIFNHFDESKMFIETQTKHGVKKIQNLPFGSFFVLGFINRIKLKRAYINQVQPFRIFLRWAFFFDPVFLFVNGFKVAWFFIKMRFITHPMRFARIKKTLLLLLEAIHRPSLEEIAESLFTGPGNESLSYDTLIMGHNHQATTRIFPGGKQYINTGTWVPLTSLDISTLGHRIRRTYALIEYEGNVPKASLKVWNGNPQIAEDF